MRQLLESLGYKFTGTCNCDGYLTHKYKNGDYKIKWRIQRAQFKILKHGITVTNWESIANDYLIKELHNVAV